MPKRIHLALIAVIALVIAGCNSAVATPSPAATITPTLTPTARPAATASLSQAANADPFAGQPYDIELPVGWQVLDMSTLNQASLDAFAQANPGLAGALQAFRSVPNVRLATNQLLGQAMVLLAIPSQGLSLDTIGQSLTAQFQNVPGVQGKPVATSVTLPGGPALHWPISLSANKAGGGTMKVDESVYLLADDKTAIIAEFVTPSGGTVPDEAKILSTLKFRTGAT